MKGGLRGKGTEKGKGGINQARIHTQKLQVIGQ